MIPLRPLRFALPPSRRSPSPDLAALKNLRARRLTSIFGLVIFIKQMFS
jgi:hypothetical protein